MSTVPESRRRPLFNIRHRMVLARETAEMEQAAMAAALGVSRTTVSNYERGFTTPKRATLLAWAMATGVDSEWLERGTENPRPVGPGGGALLPGLDSNQEPIGLQPIVALRRRAA